MKPVREIPQRESRERVPDPEKTNANGGWEFTGQFKTRFCTLPLEGPTSKAVSVAGRAVTGADRTGPARPSRGGSYEGHDVMDTNDSAPRSLSPRTLADISCLAFGLSLLAWGLAPAVIERVITDNPPQWQTLAVGGVTLMFAVGFLLLPWLNQGGARWPLWAAHILSVLMIIMIVLYAVFADVRLSVFPVILAACTMATTWFAIRAASLEAAADAVLRERIAGSIPNSQHRDWGY